MHPAETPIPRFFREMQACGEIYPAHLLHINKTVAGPSLLLLSFLFGLPVVGLQMINHHLSASHFPSQGHQHRLGAGPLGESIEAFSKAILACSSIPIPCRA